MGRGWKFLSGDVNWRKYGGQWFRVVDQSKTIDPQWKCPLNAYHVIEFTNFEEALGEGRYDKEQGKYVAVCQSIDLGYDAWRNNIPRALQSGGHTVAWVMKLPMMQREQMILEDMSYYSGGDQVFSMSGNNAREVLAEVMQRG